MNGNQTVLTVASFDCLGGWVVDTQSMDQVGSPYLLAHGLGRPVEDAVAKVSLRTQKTQDIADSEVRSHPHCGRSTHSGIDEVLANKIARFHELSVQNPEELDEDAKKEIVGAIEQTESILLRQPEDERVRRFVKGYWDGDANVIREIVEWGNSIVPERVENKFIGEIQTHKNSIRSILFHTRFRGPLKILVLEKLADILRDAVLFNKGRDGDETFYNLAHRLRFDPGNGIGARNFVARVIVKETADGNRTWTVEFSNEKELTGMPTTGKAATAEVTRLKSPSTHTILKTIYAVKAQVSTRNVRVWVRTRDWVSPQGPGRFVVKIGDWTSKELGVGNGEWHWEDCGVVELPEGEVEIRLHDLTGFEGRCAGIALTYDTMRNTADDKSISSQVNTYDFVVVGGGYAGMCAAVAAARKGVKVALVQDRPVWGGNASSEVRVGPIGGLGLKPFPANSDLAYELKALTHVDGERTSGGLRPIVDNAKLDAWLKAEKNLTTFECTKMVEARTECSGRAQRRITLIVCQCWRTGERIELTARHFADCTGDGTLAVLAGAEYREQPETKAETGEELATEGSSKGGYGNTNFWTTRWTDRETSFPSCPWALQIDETNWQVNRPKFSVEGDFPYAAGWNWESGFDRNPFTDAEQIRDYNLRAAYGMWDYLKNKSPDRAKYARAEMDWLGFVLGKRAARRIVGDYVLCEQDLTQHREQPDGVVTTTWFLDLHFPHPANAAAFPEGAFRSMAYDDPMYAQLAPQGKGRQIKIAPYAIPFRCFYSKNVENLWMAGKDISCTHVAMSSVRVENTTAQMGAMVGRAVALCVKNGWSPRQLGAEHFGELARTLKKPGKLTRLAKRGQGRAGVKGEVRYWLRVGYHKFKKLVGASYLEELAG